MTTTHCIFGCSCDLFDVGDALDDGAPNAVVQAAAAPPQEDMHNFIDHVFGTKYAPQHCAYGNIEYNNLLCVLLSLSATSVSL